MKKPLLVLFAALLLSGCVLPDVQLSPETASGAAIMPPVPGLKLATVSNVTISAAWSDASGQHSKEWTFRHRFRPNPPTPDPGVTNDPPAPDPVVTNQPPAPIPGDDVDIRGAQIASKHKHNPSAATITAQLTSARIEGSNVRLAFSGIDWPAQTGSNGKSTDGGVCILWRESSGALVGGFFDHHGVGQIVKTLENIPGGYMDGKQPAHGAPVWFYLIDYANKHRTNVKAGGTWAGLKFIPGITVQDCHYDF